MGLQPTNTVGRASRSLWCSQLNPCSVMQSAARPRRGAQGAISRKRHYISSGYFEKIAFVRLTTRAAARIVAACLAGTARLELDALTWLLTRADALAPESTARLMQIAMRFAAPAERARPV